MRPTVSVVIPTYNRSGFVQEAIGSVLTQTYRDYEIIVVDDGSTDGTGAALRARFGHHVEYHWQQNHGESVARNRGLELSRGRYIAFLDSDDLWLPQKLEKQVSILDTNPPIDLLFGPVWVIDAEGSLMRHRPLPAEVRPGDLELDRLCTADLATQPSTFLVRRSAIESLGGFDAAIRYGEDWDFVLRTILDGRRIHFFPEVLVKLRRHRGTQCHYPTRERLDRVLQDHLLVLRNAFERHPESFPERLLKWSMAYQYVQASLDALNLTMPAQSQTYLQKAFRLERRILYDTERYGQSIVDHAIAYATDNTGGSKPKMARRFAQHALTFRGALVSSSEAFDPWVLSRLEMTFGFRAYAQGDTRRSRHHMLRALRIDLNSLRNVGFLSIVAELMLGSALANKARRIARMMLPLRTRSSKHNAA